jgi:hypothetical protein
MPNCRSWVTLVSARDCPAYDDGSAAEANRAKDELHQFIHEDAGNGETPRQQPP